MLFCKEIWCSQNINLFSFRLYIILSKSSKISQPFLLNFGIIMYRHLQSVRKFINFYFYYNIIGVRFNINRFFFLLVAFHFIYTKSFITNFPSFVFITTFIFRMLYTSGWFLFFLFFFFVFKCLGFLYFRMISIFFLRYLQ